MNLLGGRILVKGDYDFITPELLEALTEARLNVVAVKLIHLLQLRIDSCRPFRGRTLNANPNRLHGTGMKAIHSFSSGSE